LMVVNKPLHSNDNFANYVRFSKSVSSENFFKQSFHSVLEV
jgi:hypothetical protein